MSDGEGIKKTMDWIRNKARAIRLAIIQKNHLKAWIIDGRR